MPESSRSSVLREVMGVYGLSLLLTLLVVFAGQILPFIQENALALVAVIFLYLPAAVLRRRGLEPADFGLTLQGARRGIAVGLLLTVITLPFFWIGYHAWEVLVLGHRLELRLDNYQTWPDEIRVQPDEISQGAVLWRNQRNLILSWRGPGYWQIRLETDGRLQHLGGPTPRVIQEEPFQTWEITTPRGGHNLAFLAYSGHRLSIDIQRDGIPLPAELLRLGNRPVSPPDLPLTIERSCWWILLWLAIQLLLVALPEEFFYRGYIQTRLDAIFPARWHLGPFHLSPAILITSLLFALGHFLIGLEPQRLAVFFPSLLFGWLRDRSRGLAAPIVFHAACNLMVQFTVVHYWPM
ncbi:MAG: CPBP family intramembrane metalloprotease [Bradymonadales bacterium]|nr:CPBP family intramembrane metalloprotease [Bradymonadales bacterium]